MKKVAMLFAVVFCLICAGSAAFAQSPPMEIVGADYVVGGGKAEQLEILIVGPEGDTPLNPEMVTFSSEDPSVKFKLDKKTGHWTMKAKPVKESRSLVVTAKISWGEEEEILEKIVPIIPKNSDDVGLARESSREAKDRIKVAYKNLENAIANDPKRVVEEAETERLVATAAFVPVRIYVASFSNLRVYAGTTTNWIYVVAVDASGATKIVSPYTTFTLSKSGVITFPYLLNSANHGNFRAGYLYATVKLTGKYVGKLAYANISVIHR